MQLYVDEQKSAKFTGTLYQRQGDNRYFMDEKMTLQAIIYPAKEGTEKGKLLSTFNIVILPFLPVIEQFHMDVK